ncbi:MAG: hypothetical protein FWF94_07100 [Oscillospiraceae bacterium]|nr:hypothetical protein [Oscillospiraceae bacterium]
MQKPKKRATPFDMISSDGRAVLRNANAGAAFDSVDVNDIITDKVNISSQNADTGLPSYNPDDTRPYEQKNTSAGFHKSGVNSK